LYLDALARLVLGDDAAQRLRGVDMAPAEASDDVAGLKACFRGRAVAHDFGDERALGLVQAERRCKIFVDALDLHAEPAALDGPPVLELCDHRGRLVRGDRKPDADVAAVWREDGGVHADDLALDIEDRAAGITAIDRRIDL